VPCRLVASSLSGIIGSGKVPGFPAMVTTFDPIMAKTTLQLNVTSPASLVLVHKMYAISPGWQYYTDQFSSCRMLDASQFLRAEGFTQTLTALGF
jgi:hypothetical protein